ncbi:MAG: hypothetical protein P4M14_00380 [Gammaproteobacteria bacterium]|nr:hypothetical protein [Gammaproteobacteria bacterium]
MMKQITQSLVMIMHPAQPFLEWIVELGAHLANEKDHPPADTDELTNITAVFIYKNPDLSKFNEFLMTHSETLLRHEFSRWTKNKALWPLRNDVEMLLDYFRVELYDNIVDFRENATDVSRIAILRPTIKLKTWLKSVLTAIGENTAEIDFTSPNSFQSVSTALFLPETVKTISESVKFIQNQYTALFDYELNRYIADEKFWPEKRSSELFAEWFELDLYAKPYVLKS